MHFFYEMHISRALQSPRDFDYGPGPGLSPSPKVGPRALEKTRAPGRARAGLRPGPITNTERGTEIFLSSNHGND